MKLYNPLTGDYDYDETFLQHAKESVSFMENNMLDPLRNGKSTGIDDIPYEVLKFDCVIEVIHRLFMLCFESNIIPSNWRRAIVCPIFKDVFLKMLIVTQEYRLIIAAESAYCLLFTRSIVLL